MKIDEPKTPYGAYDSDDEEEKDELDANLLAARITADGHKEPRRRRYFLTYISLVGFLFLKFLCDLFIYLLRNPCHHQGNDRGPTHQQFSARKTFGHSYQRNSGSPAVYFKMATGPSFS